MQNGYHKDDLDLQDDWLDWFFLKNFSKGPGYWRNLPEDKLNALIAFQQEFEHKKLKTYFETWVELFKNMFSK